MATISRLALILLVVAIPVTYTSQNCAAVTSDRVKTVVATGNKPLTPGAILDDFSYGAPVNKWGALTGAFGSTNPKPIGNCTASYVNNTSGTTSNGKSLQLDYNVDNTNSFAGYYSSLSSTSLASPAAYTAVSFWIKGAVGGELLKIQLSNNSGDNIYLASESYPSANDATHYSRNIASVYVPDYGGAVTTGCTRRTIPFHNFANLDGFSSMKELLFIFENSQSFANNGNSSPTHGRVFIDDITFETAVQSTARIAHFGEVVSIYQGLPKGICTLGGNIGTVADKGTISYQLSSANLEYDYVYGLRLDYDVRNSGAWAAAYFIFGGGNTNESSDVPGRGGWIALPHNFSAYNYLTFKARGSSVGNPEEMKIELAYGDPLKVSAVVVYGITTTSIQTWKIPLVWSAQDPGFKNLDKTSIKQLTFVIEKDGSASGGSVAASKTGRVFIDSVQFEQ